MNGWSILRLGATLFALLCALTLTAGSSIRQRSDGCGPHPLIALAVASRPFGSSTASLNEVLRAVRADPDVWSEMQILLRRYDDCIRAGDGLHFKRDTSSAGAADLTRPLLASPSWSSFQ